MNNRVSYRFKTQEEFIQEFGPAWRVRVLYQWPSFMDRLFGFPVSKKDWNQAKGGLHYPLNIQNPTAKRALHGLDKPKKSGPLVSVSADMLTTNPLPAERPQVICTEPVEVTEKPSPVMPIKVEKTSSGTAYYITEGVFVQRNYDHPPYISARGALIYSPEDAERFIATLRDAVTFMKMLGSSSGFRGGQWERKKCKICGKTRTCYKLSKGYMCGPCLRSITIKGERV